MIGLFSRAIPFAFNSSMDCSKSCIGSQLTSMDCSMDCSKLYKLTAKLHRLTGIFRHQSSQAIVRRCSVKKVFLEILQNSQENTTGGCLEIFLPRTTIFQNISKHWLSVISYSIFLLFQCADLEIHSQLQLVQRNKQLCSSRKGRIK